MQAVILVGGEGTRLRPLTYALPKPMAPLLGRPFIGWIIERLRAAGVDDVILSCFYLPEKIQAYFGDGSAHGVRLRYVHEVEPLGTAGAIKNAVEHIEGTIYACNGDILTSVDLVKLREFHHSRNAVATIHTRPVDDPSHFGVVETDANGRVLRFLEKPKPDQTSARDINAGTYVLEPEAVEAIPDGRPASIERETFPYLIEQTGRVYALPTEDYWIDVGRPDSYLEAHMDILNGDFAQPVGVEISPGVWSADGTQPPSGVEIKRPVYLGRGVRLEPGVRLESYAVIYEGCSIGAGAVVSGSILWPGCRIGARAVIKDAVLGLDAVVEQDAEVKPGTVLGKGERIGASAPASAGTSPAAT